MIIKALSNVHFGTNFTPNVSKNIEPSEPKKDEKELYYALEALSTLNKTAFEKEYENKINEAEEIEYKSDLPDSLKMYIKEISAIPRLTQEETVELSKEIKETNSKEAIKRLADGNLRLVVYVAKQYGWAKVPLLDLIQEGNIGLMKAASTYDYEKGSFSTYATNWIKGYIRAAVKDRTIKIPRNSIDLLSKMGQASGEFLIEHGREPNLDEIAEILNVKPEYLNYIIKTAQDTKPISLDVAVGEEEDDSIGSLIASDLPSPEDVVLKEDTKNLVWGYLDKLKPNEKEIIVSRYGLDNKGVRSNREIAEKFGVSTSRIGQIEARAMRKLKIISGANKLNKYDPKCTKNLCPIM